MTTSAESVSRPDEIRRLRAGGMTLAAICDQLGVAKSIVNRALYERVREYERNYNRQRYYTVTCGRCGGPCTFNVYSKASRGRWCRACYDAARSECRAD